jgi:hypothetical protein
VTEPTRTEQLRARWGLREVDRRRWELEQKAATECSSSQDERRVTRRKRAPRIPRGTVEFAVSRRHESFSFEDAAQLVLTMQALRRYFKQGRMR